MNLENLIKKAEEIKNRNGVKRTEKKVIIKRFEELGIEEPYVVLKKPTTTEFLSIKEHANTNFSIATCMTRPDLNDKELQKAYGVNNSASLVGKLFTEEEIQELDAILGELVITKTQVQIVDDIKNL